MKFYIANFSNLRYFTPNMIPISTCNSDPAWFHNFNGKDYCFVDKNNVLNGIREETFLLPDGKFEQLDEHCDKDCPYRPKLPHCEFLDVYRAHLATIDFDYLLSEFARLACEVKMITKFEGEPIIVLLVWEAETNPCSERVPLQELFAANGINLYNWKRNGL